MTRAANADAMMALRIRTLSADTILVWGRPVNLNRSLAPSSQFRIPGFALGCAAQRKGGFRRRSPMTERAGKAEALRHIGGRYAVLAAAVIAVACAWNLSAQAPAPAAGAGGRGAAATTS